MKQLEHIKTRVLGDSESLRIASRVRVPYSMEELGLQIRGTALLALTNSRLLLVSDGRRASRATILGEWPTGQLHISVRKPKVGSKLIQIATAPGIDLRFEWVDGDRPSIWASYRFRQ